TAADYSSPLTLVLTAVDDAVVQGFHTDFISYTVTSADVDTDLTRASYLVDGDFDLPGVQEIPASKPTSFLFLTDKPDLSQPVTVLLDADGAGGPGTDVAVPAFDPNDVAQQTDNTLRYRISGSTLTFYENGLPASVSGAVHVSYSYVKAGY